MNSYIQHVMHPENYHEGWIKTPFFEGWYFKLVTADRQAAYAFIVGVFRKPSRAESHAFIQVLDGNTGDVKVFDFPHEAFYFNRETFEIRIGNNQFTRQAMTLDLSDDSYHLAGKVSFGPGEGWPVRWFAPGIMGFFGWLNTMECYHGLLSFDHSLDGRLEINGQGDEPADGIHSNHRAGLRFCPEGWVERTLF